MRIKTLFLTLAVMLLAFMSTLSASAADYVKVSDKMAKTLILLCLRNLLLLSLPPL